MRARGQREQRLDAVREDGAEDEAVRDCAGLHAERFSRLGSGAGFRGQDPDPVGRVGLACSERAHRNSIRRRLLVSVMDGKLIRSDPTALVAVSVSVGR